MKPQILFLDIDGVLNSHQSWIRVFRSNMDNPLRYDDVWEKRRISNICPIAMSNLLLITEAVPDLKIVISSTWRNEYANTDPEYGMSLVQGVLGPLGLDTSKIIGKTPKLTGHHHKTRSAEIVAWLETNPKCDYVILDDGFMDLDARDTFIWGIQENFIQIDPRIGLDYIQALKAIERFNPDFSYLDPEGKPITL